MTTPVWKSIAPSKLVEELLRVLEDPDAVGLAAGDSRWGKEVYLWAGGEPLPQDWMVESLREAYRAVIVLRARVRWSSLSIREWFLMLNNYLSFEAPFQVLARDLPRFRKYLDGLYVYPVCPECQERALEKVGETIACFACGFSSRPY